jgi:hypothetical protein
MQNTTGYTERYWIYKIEQDIEMDLQNRAGHAGSTGTRFTEYNWMNRVEADVKNIKLVDWTALDIKKTETELDIQSGAAYTE